MLGKSLICDITYFHKSLLMFLLLNISSYEPYSCSKLFDFFTIFFMYYSKYFEVLRRY